nr:MAG TPA: hypothetical protein [Caudoviricetes sp.]
MFCHIVTSFFFIKFNYILSRLNKFVYCDFCVIIV